MPKLLPFAIALVSSVLAASSSALARQDVLVRCNERRWLRQERGYRLEARFSDRALSAVRLNLSRDGKRLLFPADKDILEGWSARASIGPDELRIVLKGIDPGEHLRLTNSVVRGRKNERVTHLFRHDEEDGLEEFRAYLSFLFTDESGEEASSEDLPMDCRLFGAARDRSFQVETNRIEYSPPSVPVFEF